MEHGDPGDEDRMRGPCLYRCLKCHVSCVLLAGEEEDGRLLCYRCRFEADKGTR